MTRSDRDLPPTVDGRAELAQRVRAAPGLFVGLDFDGTLAPIVADPDEATVDPAVVDPLEDLCTASDVTVAVVSGRALADLADRVPVEGAVLGGNHGMALRRDGERTVAPAAADAREALDGAVDRIDAAVGDLPGCRIEDKGLTASVHVRKVPDEQVPAVRRSVEAVVDAAPDLECSAGKAVFEVRPAVDVDKGTAVDTLRESVPDDWLALYVGDDTTDEDAFRAIQPAGVGVHVGDDPDTAASAALPDRSAVPQFLQWLATTAPERSSGTEN